MSGGRGEVRERSPVWQLNADAPRAYGARHGAHARARPAAGCAVRCQRGRHLASGTSASDARDGAAGGGGGAQRVAAAGGGSGRGGGGGGVHAAVPAACRVRRASLWHQPDAPALRPPLPRAVREDGPALGGPRARPGAALWRHALVCARARRRERVAREPRAGGGRRRRSVGPLRRALADRLGKGDVRTTSPQPAAARHELPRFSTTPVAVVRGCRPHVARRAAA